MYCKEELEVVTKEIQTALMMIDAGYSIKLEDIASACLRKAYWIRHTNACTRNRLRREKERESHIQRLNQSKGEWS